MLGTILLVGLLLALSAALSTWNHSRAWGLPLTLIGMVLTSIGGPLHASESSNSGESRVGAGETTSLRFTYSTALINTDVLPGAAGKLNVKFNRLGTVSNQRFSLTLVNLQDSTAYPLAAFIGSDTTTTSVPTATSDANGKFKVIYFNNNGSAGRSGNLLPEALNPLNNLRELNILGAGQTLLRAEVIHADRFNYRFRGPLSNTGAIPAAAGVLQLNATARVTHFGLKVTGLPPSTDFLLAINVSVTQKVTSDSHGKLKVRTLPSGSPNALGIHTVALIQDASGVVVLFINGLGIPPDNSAPTVLSTTPADTATDVPTNAKIGVAFSKAVLPATITTTNFTLTGPGTTPVAGTIAYDTTTNIAIFAPAAALATSTLFTGMLAAGVQDYSGNVLANNVTWTFTTGLVSDTSAPFVLSTLPADAATGVPINRPISATFNKTMDAATFNAATFMLQQGSTAISGNLSYAGTTATFTPASNLATNATFTGTITTAVTDLAGNELASTFTWSFTTGAAAAAGPAPVVLGSANTFAVLAGSTVTSVGPTQLNGDLGVSPGSAVTGFPPGLVSGSIHAGDGAAAQAKNDLLSAYNDSAGRLGAAVLPGNLGGLTFTPGLYKNSSSTMISGTGTNAILTLDAQGDANAVFIFQMGSTLTTDPGTQVVLSGSAKAANVYWQVGSSATIGTTTIFKGNILADQSITLTTGATLEGRALTRIGAVALDSNTITVPAP